MGIRTEFVNGHRVTDADSAEIAEMVLSGRINKQVVSRLNRAGGRAVGLSGTDAGMLRVRRHRPSGRDIGFVGEIEAVDTKPLELLLEADYIPVLSSTAADSAGQPHNINADLVAGAVAAATRATKLVFLSDVEGVMTDGVLRSSLNELEARELLATGAASGGMRPKLEAALAALAAVCRAGPCDRRPPGPRIAARGLDRSRGRHSAPVGGGGRGGGRAMRSPEWAGTLDRRGEQALLRTYARYPLELAAGSGCHLVGSDGRRYLDFTAGIAVNVLGHGHPAIVSELHSAAGGLLHVSNLYWTEPMVRLAERLTHAAGMEKAFFCNSGAEAVEAAIKLARRARPGRPRIICFDRSFHGRTLGALSVTAQGKYREPFQPLLAEIEILPFGDFEAASHAVDEDVALVLVEPIQGEGGMRPAPPGWLAHLRARCDEAGAILVFDEVQSGVGRTGAFCAFQRESVVPDAVTLAKALAGGLPMGALLARGPLIEAFQPGDHASTFGGGPFVAAIANAVLDVVLGDDFLAEVVAKGEHLDALLLGLAERSPIVAATRGPGLMRGIVLVSPLAAPVVESARERGLLVCPAGANVVRLVPPLTITRQEISEGVAMLEHALAEHSSGGTSR